MKAEHQKKMEDYTEEKLEIVYHSLSRISQNLEAKTTIAASARATTRTTSR
jgi:hypothetical protein